MILKTGMTILINVDVEKVTQNDNPSEVGVADENIAIYNIYVHCTALYNVQCSVCMK